MQRLANPSLSSLGEVALARYRQALWKQEDLTSSSRHNYLSDLRHFAAWYEANYVRNRDDTASCQTEFDPQAITMPVLTRYRVYLQKTFIRPNSMDRALISLRRYFGWAMQKQLIAYDPSIPVKLVEQEDTAPQHLGDQEEQTLVAAVTSQGTLRGIVPLLSCY